MKRIELPKGQYSLVDDEDRENLRIVTPSQNAMNRVKSSKNTSGFKGVYLDKKTKKWKAAICLNKKIIYLGSFEKKEDAALAYDNAAKKYHGEFACFNLLNGGGAEKNKRADSKFKPRLPYYLQDKRDELIWALSFQGLSQSDIGKMFNLHTSTINAIVSTMPIGWTPKWVKRESV